MLPQHSQQRVALPLRELYDTRRKDTVYKKCLAAGQRVRADHRMLGSGIHLIVFFLRSIPTAVDRFTIMHGRHTLEKTLHRRRK